MLLNKGILTIRLRLCAFQQLPQLRPEQAGPGESLKYLWDCNGGGKMLFIFAGNANEARFIAEMQGLSPSKWRYVRGSEVLRGLDRGGTCWLYGKYAIRGDAEEILNMLHQRNFDTPDMNAWERKHRARCLKPIRERKKVASL